MVSRDRRQATEFAYQRLPMRMAWRLLDLSNRGRIIPGPDQQAVASVLGAWREDFAVLLRRFRETVLLKSDYGRIELSHATGQRAEDERITR